MLDVKNLKVSIENKEILRGIDLEVGAGRRPGGRSGPEGEIHVLMGPNGSGKSTLAQVLMGSSQFTVHSSQFSFKGQDISKLTPDKRARLGIFLAFQHPVEISGVSVFNVLRRAKQVRPREHSRSVIKAPSGFHSGSGAMGAKSVTPLYNRITKGNGFDAKAFREELVGYLMDLRLSQDFLRRSLNEGFSGGEKKRSSETETGDFRRD